MATCGGEKQILLFLFRQFLERANGLLGTWKISEDRDGAGQEGGPFREQDPDQGRCIREERGGWGAARGMGNSPPSRSPGMTSGGTL